MIHITDKHNCCGCSACAQACPKQCITMKEDNEGFLYPNVNLEQCIDCHLCEKVCPCLNKGEAHEPLKVVAAINPNEEIRMQSSSGGIFTLLAETIINGGGVVFGARFDTEWNVVHDYTETIDGLAAFRGSKYVQSVIGTTYQQAKKFLTEGRKVLFSGTPCQIAGLKRFLRKEYDNLLAVECVCHGVPSPGLWQQYLKEETAKNKKAKTDIASINFRSKISGWTRYSVEIIYSDGNRFLEYHGDNPWTRSFIYNLNLRSSCTLCPAKCKISHADITLGDFWGANKILQQTDDKGITLGICHTKQGWNICKKIMCQEFDFEQILLFNKSIIHNTKENPKRTLFFKKAFSKFIHTVNSIAQPPLSIRIKLMIAKLIGK